MVSDNSGMHRVDPGTFRPAPTARGRSVLIVEEEPLTQARITALLESAGYLVTCVASVQQARQAVAAVYYPMIVLNRQLADGDGLTLCTEIRAARRPSRVFVLMLSARASSLDVGEGLRAGADAYLSKRTSDGELLAYLEAAAVVAEFAGRTPAANVAGG